MSNKKLRKITGVLLILGAVLVNVPYTLLIMNFDYPDILRLPAGEILERFAASGTPLVWTWLAFAWVGLPILMGILLLPKAMEDESPAGQTALYFGSAGALAQIVGLLRWPFVVTALAQTYTDPASSLATREATAAVFQAVHQYGGVVLGEHIGQLFTIIWMAALSLSILQSKRFPRWFAVSGLVIGGVYLLAQGELLATALPGFPVWGEAGLIGSILWLVWLIIFGVLLLQSAKDVE